MAEAMNNYLNKCTETIDFEIMPIVRDLIEEEPALTFDRFKLHSLMYGICHPSTTDKEITVEPHSTVLAGCRQLFNTINSYFANYLSEKANEFKRIEDPYDFLAAFNRFSRKFLNRLHKFNTCADYLNNFIHMRDWHGSDLTEMHIFATDFWTRQMMGTNSIVCYSILNLIDKERQFDKTFADVICPAAKLMFRMNNKLYFGEYEFLFLMKTKMYLDAEARKQLDNLTFVEYMRWARRTLKNETERIQRYLPSEIRQAEQSLIEFCNQELVLHFSDVFFQNFPSLLRASDNINDLRIFYSLISYKEDNLKVMSDLYAADVENQLKDLQATISNCQEFVEKIGMFIEIQERILEESFQNSTNFWNQFEKVMATVCEADDVTKKLLKYCDYLLTTKWQLDAILAQSNLVASVVKYSIHHEEFVKSYVNSMSERVLSFKFRVYVEDIVVQALEKVILPAVSYRLTRLLPDLKQSMSLCSKVDPKLDLHILCQAYWTSTRTSFCVNQQLPAFFSNVTNQVEAMYKESFPKRKLIWQTDRFVIDIVSKCFDKNYVFEANMVHAAILLAYNQTDCLTGDELWKASGLKSKADLDLYLDQLCTARILVKSASAFKLNFEYSNGTMAPVNLIGGLKARKPVSRNTRGPKPSDVSVKELIQCAAVRLMKSLRTCPKNDLYAKIGEELKKFCCAPVAEITKQLNSLVNRDFLQFSDNIYTYVP